MYQSEREAEYAAMFEDWIQKEEIPLATMLEAVYETGNVDDLMDCLDKLSCDLDHPYKVKAPKIKKIEE